MGGAAPPRPRFAPTEAHDGIPLDGLGVHEACVGFVDAGLASAVHAAQLLPLLAQVRRRRASAAKPRSLTPPAIRRSA